MEVLTRLNPNKMPGVDQIYLVMLKNLANELAIPLSHIFKCSMATGIVPEDWRIANVAVIHKRGPKKECGNYRPVSLTSQVSKVLETLVRDAILDHLYSKKLIRETQHGFTTGKSCLTNLLKFLEEVTKYVDEGNPVDVLYLDFSKAFDKVPHKRLVEKVKAHGIGSNIWRWIEAWLSERRQRVVINGKASGWEKVTSGVPQGSVLGLTLFIIYINDIDDGITSSLLKFADDTKLLRKVGTQDDCEELQKDLHRMYKWSEDWQIMFNIDKCNCLHIGHGNSRTTYQLGGTEVPTATQEKDLGIIVTENLKVSEQCAKVTKTANKVLGIIKWSYEDKSMAILLPLYKALVRPHIEYCVQAWRPYYQKDVDNLEKIQRRATRMMEELRGMEYEERLRQTRLVILEARRTRADIIEVFKIMKGLEGLNREDFF